MFDSRDRWLEHNEVTNICRIGYPSWINADPEPLGECYVCGEDIYDDLDFDDDGRAIHSDCKEEAENE